MMARVRGVMARSTALGSRLSVLRSTSAKTGRAPARTTAFAHETNVKLGRTTSSPGPTSESWIAASRAIVQELMKSGFVPSSTRPEIRFGGPSQRAVTGAAPAKQPHRRPAAASGLSNQRRDNGSRDARTGVPPSAASRSAGPGFAASSFRLDIAFRPGAVQRRDPQRIPARALYTDVRRAPD
jgi:hypothetical protein